MHEHKTLHDKWYKNESYRMKINSFYRLCVLMFGLLAGMQVHATDMDSKLDAIRQSLDVIADLMHQKKCTANCEKTSSCWPRAYLVLRDDNLRTNLYNALMAGLFVDEFSDPFTAAQTVGLANKIYALMFDENNNLLSPVAPLPIGSCSPDGLEEPYNDLISWAKKTFSTENILNQTAQEVLNNVIIDAGYLRSISAKDYQKASDFWGPHQLQRGSGELLTAAQKEQLNKRKKVRTSIDDFSNKNTLKDQPKKVQNVFRSQAIDQKIAALAEKNRPEKQTQNASIAPDSQKKSTSFWSFFGVA